MRFDKSLFDFFRDLAQHNDREWFQANKTRYEEDVRGPLMTFVEHFAADLETISPRFVADPKPVGGSLFRIHRDVRFSRDKRPYKTWGALQFRHEQGRDVHAPGFYLHLEPDRVFAGAGLWHPDRDALRKIREAIVDRPDDWRAAARDRAFRRRFTFGGDSLVRSPKGFPADHPHGEDLRRKDFIAVANFTEADACSPRFRSQYASTCRSSAPFMRFLTAAVDLPW